MKRYTGVEPREGYRVVIRRPQRKGRKAFTTFKKSIYEECETNERCLTEALEQMENVENRRLGVEIYIEELVGDEWVPVLAFAWNDKYQWEKKELFKPVSSETAQVRVALVLPGSSNVRVWNCGDEVGHCHGILGGVRVNPYAQVDGAQLHVQVRTPSGAWGSSRYEEFRGNRWHFVAMPSELVYLRNRRAR